MKNIIFVVMSLLLTQVGFAAQSLLPYAIENTRILGRIDSLQKAHQSLRDKYVSEMTSTVFSILSKDKTIGSCKIENAWLLVDEIYVRYWFQNKAYTAHLERKDLNAISKSGNIELGGEKYVYNQSLDGFKLTLTPSGSLKEVELIGQEYGDSFPGYDVVKCIKGESRYEGVD